MKKLFTFFAIAALMLSSCTHTIIFDKEPVTTPDDEIVIPEGATVIYYTTTDGKAIQASATKIANILSNTYKNDEGVLIIKGTLEEIPEKAFNNFTTLKSIIIPDGVSKIGNSAFAYLAGLTSVTIPDSVISIGEFAFSGCNVMTSITIGSGVVSIGRNAFYGCAGELYVNCNIPSNAFCDSGFIKVIIGNNVTTIGDYAFDSCSNLKSVTISESVIEMGKRVFSECPNITAFYGKFASADNKCLIIDGYLDTFASACGDTEYTIPKGVNGIVEFSFKNCQSLESLIIPDGVTWIDYLAFDDCNNLKYITIPDSITWVGSFAFRGCPIVTFYDTHGIGSKCYILNDVFHRFATGYSISEYTLPNKVKVIESGAFHNCPTITTITIPEGVTAIYQRVFADCKNLTHIYCKAITPPITDRDVGVFWGNGWGAFENNAVGRKIYVPRASVDAYKAADGWKDYADAIEPYDF